VLNIHWLKDRFGISSTEPARQSIKNSVHQFDRVKIRRVKLLTSKNTFVACSAASSAVISSKGICIGFFDVGPSVNCKTKNKNKNGWSQIIVTTLIFAPFSGLQSLIHSSPWMKASASFSAKDSSNLSDDAAP
jgi:hypothetical protein